MEVARSPEVGDSSQVSIPTRKIETMHLLRKRPILFVPLVKVRDLTLAFQMERGRPPLSFKKGAFTHSSLLLSYLFV